MTDVNRTGLYGGCGVFRTVCGGVALLMLGLIPVIGSAVLIAGGSLLASSFLVICGASIVAATIVAFYGQAVMRAADRNTPSVSTPAPAKRSGFGQVAGALMLGFLGLPAIVGSLAVIRSGDFFTTKFIVIAFGSVVAALLIFVYAQATAKATTRFAHVARRR